MRVILLILAAYAFVGWNDANAACQRFKPDGTVEACQHIAPGSSRLRPKASGIYCRILMKTASLLWRGVGLRTV
jgi:hypothetical protein